MRLTVLGGCGAFPAAGVACSGYLVEHDGFRLLVDPGHPDHSAGPITVASPGLTAEIDR